MVNPSYNYILEILRSVLGNLVWTYNAQENYVDWDDSFMVILAATEFENFSTIKMLKHYIPGQLIFFRGKLSESNIYQPGNEHISENRSK